MKFEKGKKYLVERSNKATGGGIFELQVENITKEYIKYNDKWHTIKSTEEHWRILEKFEDE